MKTTINHKKKQITFPIPSTSFVPDYLKYLLEYNNVPNTYKLCFTDKTFNNLEEMKNGQTPKQQYTHCKHCTGMAKLHIQVNDCQVFVCPECELCTNKYV